MTFWLREKQERKGRDREDDKGIEREGKKGKENDIQRKDKIIKPPVSPPTARVTEAKTPTDNRSRKKQVYSLRTTSTSTKPDSKDIRHPK